MYLICVNSCMIGFKVILILINFIYFQIKLKTIVRYFYIAMVIKCKKR